MRINTDMRTDLIGAYKPLEAAREFASNPKDSLSSTATDTKESFGSKVYRWTMCIPNGIITVIKKIIYVLSFCTLCRDSADPKALITGLKPVIEAWDKKGAKKEDKEAAWTTFGKQFPYQKEQMLDQLVQKKKEAGKEKDWNDAKAKEARDGFVKRINDCDTSLLNSYIRDLQEQVDSKK